jgi:hypothetical protein
MVVFEIAVVFYDGRLYLLLADGIDDGVVLHHCSQVDLQS